MEKQLQEQKETLRSQLEKATEFSACKQQRLAEAQAVQEESVKHLEEHGGSGRRTKSWRSCRSGGGRDAILWRAQLERYQVLEVERGKSEVWEQRLVEQLEGVKSKVGGGWGGVDGGVVMGREEWETSKREIGVLREEMRQKKEVVRQLTEAKTALQLETEELKAELAFV